MFMLLGLLLIGGQVNSLQKEVAALEGGVVTLREFFKSDRLQFDQIGTLKRPVQTGPWTVYSQILINKAQVTGSQLRLNGLRVIHRYDEERRRLIAARSDLAVTIDIDLPKSATAADVREALSKIVIGNDDLAAHVPKYWQAYFGVKEDAALQSDPPLRVGGAAQKEKIIKQVQPARPAEARKAQLAGAVVLEAEINETGDVASLSILQPAGAGMDESAIEAVLQWKYSPTTVNEVPVKVVTTVTVTFSLAR
jgi:TonB family protein